MQEREYLGAWLYFYIEASQLRYCNCLQSIWFSDRDKSKIDDKQGGK
jgi:hypothetical protein